MKVVIATHGFFPEVGGVSTYVSVLAKGFVDDGHDVTVVALNPGPTDGYGYEVLRMLPPWRLFALYKNADVLVLSNLAIKLIYPLLVVRRKFGLQHHSESAFQLSMSPFSPDFVRRFVMHRAAKHFMTSEFIGRRSGLSGYVVTRPPFKSHDMTDDDPPTCNREGAFFAGRLEPEKGVHFLLEHVDQIRRELGVAEIRIAGVGSLQAEVKKRIASGVDGIKYLGPLPVDEVAREMGQAAFVLVPSLWEEPFGAVALEAIAAGALTIASARGGLPEAVGSIGFLYDPDDHVSFLVALRDARKVRHLHLTDRLERSRYDALRAEHVIQFSPRGVVGKIVSALSGVE